VAERWERLLRWLGKGSPQAPDRRLRGRPAAPGDGPGDRPRRRRRRLRPSGPAAPPRAPAGEAVSAGPAPLARDDDPLSRRAGEWEAYAQSSPPPPASARPSAPGTRGAGGALPARHPRHRKGRTNWEYVAAVPPEAAWRPVFVAVTRRFEREWYGSDKSSREALEATAEEARELLGALGGFGGRGGERGSRALEAARPAPSWPSRLFLVSLGDGRLAGDRAALAAPVPRSRFRLERG